MSVLVDSSAVNGSFEVAGSAVEFCLGMHFLGNVGQVLLVDDSVQS